MHNIVMISVSKRNRGCGEGDLLNGIHILTKILNKIKQPSAGVGQPDTSLATFVIF